ncbi:MAG: methionyl-tRNA formyltransferase [Agrococcus casei]|uniref:methionyl-tRNA formyltransferase n=1 Tax=Agrococcus casei TaxID=343512 RepID=UPI003F8D91C4
MRLVFAGTPEVALPTLRSLAEQHDIVAVLTRTPAPVGRKRVLEPSPVARLASELGIELIESDRPDAEVTERIRALQPELGVVVAYGALLRRDLLDAPEHGWINLHFSQLPSYRGAAPLQRMIIDGHQRVAMSVFQLAEQLDAGPVFTSRSSVLGDDETADEALARLSHEGVELVSTTVAGIASGTAEATPQLGGVSFAPKLAREDGRLDFSQDSSAVLARFKGVTSEPGAFAETADGVVKILSMTAAEPELETDAAVGLAQVVRKRVLVQTRSGVLELLHVQPAGKSAMDAGAWLRGRGGSAQFSVSGQSGVGA